MTRRVVLFSNSDLPLLSFVICMNESANSGSISCPLQVRQPQGLACLGLSWFSASGQHFRTAQTARLSCHTPDPLTPGAYPFPVFRMHLKLVGKDKKEEIIFKEGMLTKGLRLVLGKGFRLWSGCPGRRQDRKAVMMGSGKEGSMARLKGSWMGSSAETGMKGASCLRPQS